MTYSGVMSVANIAHGAGFGFGVLYGLVAFDARRRKRWIPLACFLSAMVLSTLIACPGHRGYEHVRHRKEVEQMLEELQKPPAAEGKNER